MQRIASFEVDHDLLEPGIYISRIDGDVVTYDLRTRKPNAGEYMDNVTMHSVEHMMATFLRNLPNGQDVLYFGPMGCRTGFYLLARNTITRSEILAMVLEALRDTVLHKGEVFGATRRECGNYRELDLEKAKAECDAYLSVLLRQSAAGQIDFQYRKEVQENVLG